MTLQNLSKVLDKYESQLGSTSLEQFELLKGLPFYDWQHKAGSGQNHAQAISFNHAIGLPQKKNGTLSFIRLWTVGIWHTAKSQTYMD